jgi:hypothetical protein
MGARIGIGVAIGATLALNCSTVAAAPDDAHDLGMEETASAGMAYSTTIHLATTFGVEAAVRWRAWKLGGFAQYAVGTYGNATSFGARLGPSLPVGPLELDVAPTIAWHRHFDVGAVHWPSDTCPTYPAAATAASKAARSPSDSHSICIALPFAARASTGRSPPSGRTTSIGRTSSRRAAHPVKRRGASP